VQIGTKFSKPHASSQQKKKKRGGKALPNQQVL